MDVIHWRYPTIPRLSFFTEKDVKGISYPHDDALVITLKVATSKVARTLVDTGSSVDIIFKSALDQLLIESPKITPYAIGYSTWMGQTRSVRYIQATPHGWDNREAPLECGNAMKILLKDNVLTFSLMLLFAFFNFFVW